MEKDKDPNPTVNLGVTSLSKKSIIFGPQNRKFLIAFIILFVIIGIFIIYRSFAFTAVTMTGAEGEFLAQLALSSANMAQLDLVGIAKQGLVFS